MLFVNNNTGEVNTGRKGPKSSQVQYVDIDKTFRKK
jgi:hypothetical protein